MKVIKRSNDLPLFDHLFEGFFRDEPLHWMNRNTAPTSKEKVNILEDENGFKIELLAPGFRKEDLQIEVKDNRLILKASRELGENDKDLNYLRREFKINAFERQFNLPEKRIDEAGIEARFEDGILMINLPKKEEVKNPSRLIEIN
ncbi:MAG: Hsp20/alpha crystallin family protein [Bacteroidetes bacterium]|nr:Hsp20/alpha crystallin family protein [Bacteroidota bacterium]